MVIFSSFLLSLNATMGAQKRKIVLFVDNCATHTQDASFLRNVKVIHYPTNCKSVFQLHYLGIIKCFKQLNRKCHVQTVVCLMEASKDQKKRINILEAKHYTMAAGDK